MVRPEDVPSVPFVVPPDVASYVENLSAAIDRSLKASGGVAEQPLSDRTPDLRVVEALRRLYTEAGWDVEVDADSCDLSRRGPVPWHFHVQVRRRAA
jgi:hypothetical protein